MTDYDPIEMGERIRRRRRALHMSQRHVAKRLKVAQTYISKIERGDFLGIAFPLLMDLAKLLEVRPQYLMFGEEPIEPNDLCPAEMGDGTSQPSISASVAV